MPRDYRWGLRPGWVGSRWYCKRWIGWRAGVRWREDELVGVKLEGQCREVEARGREEAERRGREQSLGEGEEELRNVELVRL